MIRGGKEREIESTIKVVTVDSVLEALVRETTGDIGERVCLVASESNFKVDRTTLVFLDVKDAKIDLDKRAG